MLKKLLSFLVALSLIFSNMVISGTSAANAATDYYVSSSSGNDSWPGTRSRPWKTLAKVSQLTFSAGDTINLKCGDTWTGEVLYLKGTGASSSNWITLQSYGTGAKPKIYPGKDSYWSVKIENTKDEDRNCGWKIKNIEVGYAKVGIASIDTRKNPKQSLDGLWVENCYIHDCKGIVEYSDPTVYWSTGLRTFSSKSTLSNVTFKNNTIVRCDVGIHPWQITNFLIDNCIVLYSGFFGMEFHHDHDGNIQNCRVLKSGVVGRPLGTTGVEFDSAVSNVTMKNTEIAYTVAPESPDGCGVDYEGANTDVTTTNCYIHDNVGRAFLVMETGGDNIRSNITNNLTENNGIRDLEPAFLRLTENKNNGGIISGNTIFKRKGQPLIVKDDKPTGAWPSAFKCYDNKVIEGGVGALTEWKLTSDLQSLASLNDISYFDWQNSGYFEDNVPNIKAKWGDRVDWIKSGTISFWDKMFKNTPDAVKAYNHYRDGTGTDLKIDYEKAYDEDAGIKSSIDALLSKAKEKAVALHKSSGKTSFNMSSDLFGIENGKTENWQKTIGAHNVWVSASVEFKNGKYTMKITVHMKDRYGFNKDMSDIAPGTKDDINGRFAQLGWARSFYTVGELSRTIIW